jgi:hypothetical protein
MLRRRSVIVKAMAKYDPLRVRLTRAGRETLAFSFTELDESKVFPDQLGNMPRGGRMKLARADGHAQARAWLGTGCHVDHIDFGENRVIFSRA